MFYLSEPGWLWVSSVIVVPILIHLTRGRSGKTLQIGSIRLLKENIISRSSSLKIRERLLLLLRCLGIVLAAFFLSDPRWKDTVSAGRNTGWVVLEKESIAGSWKHDRPLLDSLLKAGYEWHLLENNFPKATLKDSAYVPADTTSIQLPSYWELLKKLEGQIPSTLPVYVFTGNKLNRFSGNRPELSLNLHWKLLSAPDTSSAWISSAYESSPDSLVMVTGSSRNTRTWFQNTPTKKSSYESIPEGSKPIPDSDELKIGIYCPDGNPDAGYLETALETVRQYSRHPMKIFKTNKAEAVLKGEDWMFWLSDSPVPSGIQAKNLFAYQTGQSLPTQSWIYPAGRNDASGINIYRMKPAPADSGYRMIWSDGFGRPVLTVQEKEYSQYTFYSHLDPAWNDLPWSAVFPRFILQLLYPENQTSKDLTNDLRVISDLQAMPVLYSRGKTQTENDSRFTDLAPFFWILGLMVFCLERWFSWNKKKPGHD